MNNLDLDDMCDTFIWHCIVNIFVNYDTVKRSLSNAELPIYMEKLNSSNS